jgi:hypothetical protein
MKKASYFLKSILFLAVLTSLSLSASAQQDADTLKEKVTELKDQVAGIDERLLVAETDIAKHNKLKISGYLQAQYSHFENPSVYPTDFFFIRRARLKAAYEATEGLKFVVQADFIPGSVSVKDAYGILNLPKYKPLTLWVGQFNRSNYEVEYSSSQREVLERSKVIAALYPGERAIGAKLEFRPAEIPLKVQLALFNGNDALLYKDFTGVSIGTVNRDFDNYKDLMLRATYSFKFGKSIGLDVGAHGYYGGVKANSTTTIKGDYTFDKGVEIGDKVSRSWAGVEFQFFADVLGGMSIKGEYLFGQNGAPGIVIPSTSTSSMTSSLTNDTLTLTTTNTTTSMQFANHLTKFNGYYIYLIKNIGKKHQFVARYDYYDPNTDLKGEDIGVVKYTDPSHSTTSTTSTTSSSSGSQVILNKTITNTVNKFEMKSGKPDLAYGTLALAWQYYFDPNIRITFEYDIPMNEKTLEGKLVDNYTVNGEAGTLDYSEVFKQNVFSIRIQAKF